MTIKQFNAAIIGLLIFTGCSKDKAKTDGDDGGDNNGTTKQAYVADLAGSYSSDDETGAKVIRIQKDGKILVLGYQWFVRLEKDGATVDNTFKPVSGIASSTDVNSIELQDDGKIIVFGKFVLPGGRKAIVRLNTDGSLDESFNNPVLDINYKEQAIDIRAVKLLPSGKMIIAGAFSYYTPTSFEDGIAIARLNADQSLDYSFVSPIAVGDVFNVTDMLSLSDGGFLLTGYGAIKLKDGINYLAVKINADGAFDRSYVFDRGGSLNVSSLTSGDMKELPDGKVLMAWSSAGAQDFSSQVTRLNPDGSVDAGFKQFQVIGLLGSLLVLPDKSILAGNHPYLTERRCLSHLSSDGKEDTAFHPNFSPLTSISCLANLDETTVLAGGDLYINDKKYAVVRMKKSK